MWRYNTIGKCELVSIGDRICNHEGIMVTIREIFIDTPPHDVCIRHEVTYLGGFHPDFYGLCAACLLLNHDASTRVYEPYLKNMYR